MDSKEIQELLKLVSRLELAEFKYKQGDVEFSVRTKFYTKSRNGYDTGSQSLSMSSAHQQAQNREIMLEIVNGVFRALRRRPS